MTKEVKLRTAEWLSPLNQEIPPSELLRRVTANEIRSMSIEERLDAVVNELGDTDVNVVAYDKGIKINDAIELHVWVPTVRLPKCRTGDYLNVPTAVYNRIPDLAHAFLQTGTLHRIIDRRNGVANKYIVDVRENVRMLIDDSPTNGMITLEIRTHRPTRSAVQIVILLNNTPQ